MSIIDDTVVNSNVLESPSQQVSTAQQLSKTICLNMIVKNEGKIITRILDSVLPIIDTYCICDTGSTDDTKEIITAYFQEKGIPGKITEEPFIDFAHNRNFAIQRCIGMSDYILLMDADMILDINPVFNKSDILNRGHDTLMILQGTDDFYYNNARIVKNNGTFSYKGVTHEYISSRFNNQSIVNIDKSVLFIKDIGDGGSKSDKVDRDIRLLLDGIEKEPTMGDRYSFYLANTYFDKQEYETAIETFKKRIQLGGWVQEVWYSHYRIGLCYKNMGKMNDAIASWLDAYNVFPNRIENLYEIVSYYRQIGKQQSAFLFYKIAKDSLAKINPHEKDAYLFLCNDVYTYKLEYEMTIFGTYVGIRNFAHQLHTVFNHCRYQNIMTNVLSNMKFYKDILTSVNTLDSSETLKKNIHGMDIDFKSSSMSIIPLPNKHDDCVGDKCVGGYMMNKRFVNYSIDGNGRYSHYPKENIITLNKYIVFNSDFVVIDEKVFEPTFEPSTYMNGVEDVRIYNYKDQQVFIGTAQHSDGNIGVVCGDYVIDCEEGFNEIKNGQPYLESHEINCVFRQSNREKNWVFVSYAHNPDGNEKEDLKVVYDWYPLKLCWINSTNKKYTLELVRELDMPNIFAHIRGSTCGCTNYENTEIWFIVHMVSDESPRHYYHLFVVFDIHMSKLLRYSMPFSFEGEPIEFCIGLIVEENRVVIPYSTWDKTSKIGIYDKSYIDSKIQFFK